MRGAVMKICSVEGCGRRYKAKGLCDRHYRKTIKYTSCTRCGKEYGKSIQSVYCCECVEKRRLEIIEENKKKSVDLFDFDYKWLNQWISDENDEKEFSLSEWYDEDLLEEIEYYKQTGKIMKRSI